MSGVIVAIDGTNRVHTLWHVMHDAAKVVAQLARELDAIDEHLRPAGICMAFDSRESFRKRLCRDYKAHRAASPQHLIDTLDEARNLIRRSSSAVLLEVEGFEADDLLASVAHGATQRNQRTVIVSPDKDLRQCLVAGVVSILKTFKTGAGRFIPTWLTAAQHQEETGVPAARWIDYQCLVGDSTDGIVGAYGIGAKTASGWLSHWTLDQILNNRFCVHVTDKQWRCLQELRSRLDVVRQLVTLRTDSLGQQWPFSPAEVA